MNIYFDIETIPSQLPGIREELAAAIEPPGNISKAETIAAWHAEKKPALVEEAYLKTSFDGGYGQACVIGWAIEDDEPRAYSVQDLTYASERKMLEDFFCMIVDSYSLMDRPVFIGHNVIGFDMRFLWQRAMVLGVKPPPYFPRDPKPWSEAVFDTMLAWDSQQRAGGSMARLCRLFGLEGKGDMDGSKVWPMVQEGRIQEVANYCCGDVSRTRELHKRMTFAQG
jgi:predicted PolB exonuclease-like 3'-5' exonuclease